MISRLYAEMGKVAGSSEYFEHGALANNTPQFYMPSMREVAVLTLLSFILHGINGWGSTASLIPSTSI